VSGAGDFAAMGIRFRPIQRIRYWAVATAVIGAAIGTFLLLALAAALLITLRVGNALGDLVLVSRFRMKDSWLTLVEPGGVVASHFTFAVDKGAFSLA
jgi:hypothetical protein